MSTDDKKKDENDQEIYDLLSDLEIDTSSNTPKATSIKTQYEKKRNNLWKPLDKINDDDRIFWEQTGKKKKGFVNIPRSLPLILKIMDVLSPKGKPVSSTYLALWCRDFGTGFIEIKDLDLLAIEAGFKGARATTTLNSRLKILESDKLGFIRTKKGLTKKYESILMINPMLIIYLTHKDNSYVKDLYNLLYARNTDMKDIDFDLMKKFNSKQISHINNILEETKQ